MLIKDVQFLAASQLNLVRATVCVRVFDLLANTRNLALCKGPRVVLVETVSGSLTLVKYAVV